MKIWGYIVFVVLLVLLAWYMKKELGKAADAAKAAAKTAANAVDFTDPNNVSYRKATSVGQSIAGYFGDMTFTLSDLLPTSKAEQNLNQMLSK